MFLRCLGSLLYGIFYDTLTFPSEKVCHGSGWVRRRAAERECVHFRCWTSVFQHPSRVSEATVHGCWSYAFNINVDNIMDFFASSSSSPFMCRERLRWCVSDILSQVHFHIPLSFWLRNDARCFCCFDTAMFRWYQGSLWVNEMEQKKKREKTQNAINPSLENETKH